MSINTRRGFLKGAGIFGTIVGGVAAGKMIVEKHHHETKVIEAPTPVKEEISHLVPKTDNTLVITADNSDSKPLSFATSGHERMRISSTGELGIGVSSPPISSMNTVRLSVGKDDRLWVKVNDEWKRIAIES